MAALLLCVWGGAGAVGTVRCAVAQDGGRDSGSARPVVFVRRQKTDESKAIYLAAWQALEPFTNMTRRRLVTLPAGKSAAVRAALKPHADAGVFVALDHAAAATIRRLRPKAKVLEVSPHNRANVRTRVDRVALAKLVRQLAPRARRIIAYPRQALPGFEAAGSAPASAPDVAWIAEGGTPPKTIRASSVVNTSPSVPDGRAVLTVRPDTVGAGLQVAALVVAMVRDKKAPPQTGVRRLHVTVNLRAAKERGVVVPLAILARADDVRRDR